MNHKDAVRLANEMAAAMERRLIHKMAVDIYGAGKCFEPDCQWHRDEPEDDCKRCPNCGAVI